jgi:hypothetical protein
MQREMDGEVMTRRREKRPTVNDANLLLAGVPQRLHLRETGVSRWLANHATLTPRYPLLINATGSHSLPYESSDICSDNGVSYRIVWNMI